MRWRVVEEELRKRGMLEAWGDVVALLRDGADTGAPTSFTVTFTVRGASPFCSSRA